MTEEKTKKIRVRKWIKENEDIVEALFQLAWEINKGQWGKDMEFTPKIAKEALKNSGVEIPFPVETLLKTAQRMYEKGQILND